jgi:hypothetical protein
MGDLQPIGRLLILAGVILALIGAVLVLGPRIPLLGRLPGDVHFETGNVRVFLPLGTMLLISLILTIVLNVLNRR